uniref:Putative conserved secreted protein n=1 Tax=Ixodes scapularis TaxID=6945 RepID=A0A4D5RQQ4_IXOSC
MLHLTSSRATAIVLLFVLLVEPGACAQPECSLATFNRLYLPVVLKLNFKVTGQSNTPDIRKLDCDNLKEITPGVETLLEKCSADNNEYVKEKLTSLQLTKESLCGNELEEDLNLWRDCFSPSVFAECKKNVEERLGKLEQDGALQDGDKWCRNESLSYQCALKAGADCPTKADRARRAVENYINTLMDVQGCFRPTVYACEYKLFHDCHWVVVHERAKELPLLQSGEGTLAKYCKAAKSVSTCTRNVQIDQCSEQEKTYLRTVEDGFRRSLNSLCDEKLPASAEVWNNCLNQEALKNCTSKIPDPRKIDISDPHLHFCRVDEETLKCELAAGSNCPASADVAKKALYDIRMTLFDIKRCSRPKLDGYGGSGFSTTPAVLVTLSALCVALLPTKQTLLLDFN